MHVKNPSLMQAEASMHGTCDEHACGGVFSADMLDSCRCVYVCVCVCVRVRARAHVCVCVRARACVCVGGGSSHRRLWRPNERIPTLLDLPSRWCLGRQHTLKRGMPIVVVRERRCGLTAQLHVRLARPLFNLRGLHDRDCEGTIGKMRCVHVGGLVDAHKQIHWRPSATQQQKTVQTTMRPSKKCVFVS
jgi:hypothetical protein